MSVKELHLRDEARQSMQEQRRQERLEQGWHNQETLEREWQELERLKEMANLVEGEFMQLKNRLLEQ